MKLNRLLFICLLLSLFGFTLQYSQLPRGLSNEAWLNQQTTLIQAQTNIDKNVLRLALQAYSHAQKQGVITRPLLTVIDYSKPSSEKRLWVFDLSSRKILFNTWVSHGKNSGGAKALSFSNAPGSLKSSIGVFVTDLTYMGGNGYSLRIKGLERGINDNAFRRDIVFHGARYVNPDNIKKYGQVGRSWGCPAVRVDMAKSLINTIKNKTLVFAYYPDQKWLTNSRYLAG
ncbi:MAG: murein L,D-transpeptidase catalytic domain family protein [Gammaproteobacteria bacterium]|nr:murein L,D-transpeptidase catalytic domain family protein [Gammaproteobacteria bacterium]